MEVSKGPSPRHDTFTCPNCGTIISNQCHVPTGADDDKAAS